MAPGMDSSVCVLRAIYLYGSVNDATPSTGRANVSQSKRSNKPARVTEPELVEWRLTYKPVSLPARAVCRGLQALTEPSHGAYDEVGDRGCPIRGAEDQEEEV